MKLFQLTINYPFWIRIINRQKMKELFVFVKKRKLVPLSKMGSVFLLRIKTPNLQNLFPLKLNQMVLDTGQKHVDHRNYLSN